MTQTQAAASPVIVIAERDKRIRGLQTFFLEKEGFALAFAADEESAFEAVQSMLPAALVTEILIGRTDGLALCRRVRDHPETRNIPIVVFSILAAEARAIDAGASAFLRKPLIGETFVAVIQQVIAAQPSVRQE
jgi:two-component system phosphate regulon response regulator PhoB